MFMRWHGGRATAFVSTFLFPIFAFGDQTSQLPNNMVAVNSKVMEVGYSVHASAQPLRGVELYFTANEGETWQRYGMDEDLQSPFPFEVDQEGLFGLFFVLSNEVGFSSAPPEADQTPHKWVLVDSSKPLTQIKGVHVIQGKGSQPDRLVVSWAAFDNNLSDRPVALYYQVREQPGWHSMSSTISNGGRFDWSIPEEISGHLVVKIEVTDLAHNIASDSSPTVLIKGRPATDLAHGDEKGEIKIEGPPRNKVGSKISGGCQT